MTTDAEPAGAKGNITRDIKGDAKGDMKPHAPRGNLAALALGALGVVYGDIGTSPLYTFKTALDWAGGTPRRRSRSACCR